jgi:hypothetical protein
MSHWMKRVFGLSLLPAAVVLSAAPAFAVPTPKRVVVTHAKPSPPPVAKTAPATVTPGSEVMLNPQPIPPGKTSTAPVKTGGSDVMLNPQPIPPGKSPSAPSATNGNQKAIIFVGGKSTKVKTGPKGKTGAPAIPPGPPAKQKS